MSKSAPSSQAGFSLLEVLVALAILAIAMTASLRAVGMLANQTSALHQRLLASWSADSVLLEAVELDQLQASRDCPQADLALRCELAVQAAGFADLRRYDVRVHRPGQTHLLAHLITLAAPPQQGPG